MLLLSGIAVNLLQAGPALCNCRAINLFILHMPLMRLCSAVCVLQGGVEDTTGAGDAFIGTMLYGVVHHMAPGDMLRLAAVVAACKCTALGARPGLPLVKSISPELLGV